MDVYNILLVIFLSTLFLCQDKVDGSRRNLLKEEDLEIERQLKLLNKPATKTILTKFGDIYDCVDFYNQPAFDHPLLKNEIFHFEVESASSHSKNDQFSSESVPSFGFQGEACPVGTVPIRRIIKQDLIREKIAQKEKIIDLELEDIYEQVALAQTTSQTNKYFGAGGVLSIHNPNATGAQYSESRILIKNGNDAIQVGWRVDPFLYGDSKTHLFLRTDTYRSRCFEGLRCSAFIHTNRQVPIDGIFDAISVEGGNTYDIQLDIIMDSTGNWRLRMGSYDRIEIGFWPQKIFNETGLRLLANHIEYGGEVYSPPRVPKPPMGNGLFPTAFKLGPPFIRQLTYRNEQGGPKVSADDATAYVDNDQFLDIDIPHTRESDPNYWGHLVLYGGPGGKAI